MLFFGVKKNGDLEALISRTRMNQSNNYMDAAQENFKTLCARYEELLSAGKLNEKQQAHYTEIMDGLRTELDKFTHKDQRNEELIYLLYRFGMRRKEFDSFYRSNIQ